MLTLPGQTRRRSSISDLLPAYGRMRQFTTSNIHHAVDYVREKEVN